MQDKLSVENMTDALIYFTASHILQRSPLEEEVAERIKSAVTLLEDSKKSFRSKQIAEARRSLNEIIS